MLVQVSISQVKMFGFVSGFIKGRSCGSGFVLVREVHSSQTSIQSSGSHWISAQNWDFGSNPVDSVNTRVNSGQQQVKRGQQSTGRFQFRFAVRGSG
ncbi:hypothetical protein Hdeb2414_s0010g00344781 [Helianthus debilis subsp. tardiflorus]